MVILTIYNMAAQLTQCIPLHKKWDLLGLVPGKCWSTKAVRANLFAVAIINFVTDFIVALLPITFLKKVQRPLRERAIIGVLMALGIFAGVASIIKMVVSARFGKTGDMNLDGIRVGMWSLIEELVGFIAACIPCLRSPFQRVIEYFGLSSIHTKSANGKDSGRVYGHSSTIKASRKGAVQNAIKMKTIRSTDAASEENILAAPGMDGEIWCTTEVHLEEEAKQTQRNNREDMIE